MQPKTRFTPPMHNGITASTVFLPNDIDTPTLYGYLSRKFAHISPDEWQQRFNDGLVFDQQGRILTLDQPYLAAQHIYFYRHLKQESIITFDHYILFENDHFMVVDKPHFLTVSPTGQYVQQTLLTRLKKHSNNPNLTPIHRLDRETAGLILISKQIQSRGLYQQLFAQRKVHKTYHAIAAFHPDLEFPRTFTAHMQKGEPFYTMSITAGAPNSTTQMQLLQHDHIWAKYQLEPITGKQHQLRVHMNALGIALKNDQLYPNIKHLASDDFSAPLQLLAKKIQFHDPISQQDLVFSSTFELYLPNTSMLP